MAELSKRSTQREEYSMMLKELANDDQAEDNMMEVLKSVFQKQVGCGVRVQRAHGFVWYGRCIGGDLAVAMACMGLLWRMVSGSGHWQFVYAVCQPLAG